MIHPFMPGSRVWLAPIVLVFACSHAPLTPPPSTADVIARADADAWRTLDPQNLMYVMLDAGPVIVELSDTFAPRHAENVRTLVAQHYFDNLAIMRVQENYVVQWGDPTGKRPVPVSTPQAPEYARPLDDLTWARSPDGDVYATEVGWITHFPAGKSGQTVWPLHCYSVVGVGRDMPPDTGNGAELYVVTGHAPRHLDRNLAVVGRVVWGLERMTALPRGTEAMGFYAADAVKPALKWVRMGTDVPVGDQVPLEMLRTDTPTWHAYVQTKAHRVEPFFVTTADHIDICNALPPVRQHRK